jgi:hypothetical protein
VYGFVFREISWKYVIPYLDDVIIYSKNKNDHLEHIENVMKLLKNAGMVLNKNKCKFFKQEI